MQEPRLPPRRSHLELRQTLTCKSRAAPVRKSPPPCTPHALQAVHRRVRPRRVRTTPPQQLETLALSDGAGAVQTQYTYEPFGKATASGASTSNGSQFTGRENDGTGLSSSRIRYLDPEKSRFISQDPIGLQGGLNPYAYVENMPTRFTDPLGLAIGDLPPVPPGYDPSTWAIGQRGNGRWYVTDPTGKTWTAHPEDDAHWRHWDVSEDGKNPRRYPDNSKKWPPNRKRPDPTRSRRDPNGDKPSWAPPQNKPMTEPRVPLLPLPTQVPAVPEIPVPIRIPLRLPIPIFP